MNTANSLGLGGSVAQRVVVSVGDFAVASGPDVNISTYALGTCVGLLCCDFEHHVTGLLHFMLPDSTLSAEKAEKRPAMFGDTGIGVMFEAMEKLGAKQENFKVFMCGGASLLGATDHFKIGERNVEKTREILDKMGVSIHLEDIGGSHNRTLHYTAIDGCVKIKTPEGEKTLSLI